MGAAAIIGGSSIVGGLLGSSASKSAASSQSEASKYATDAQIAASDRAAKASLEAAHIAAGATRDAARRAADATIKAAELQNVGIQMAVDAQKAALADARRRNLPYEQAGKLALQSLQTLMKEGPGPFKEDPGYQFRLQQGNENIMSQQSALGNLASGRTLTALQEYGQDYASNEYDKFYNRYQQSIGNEQFLVDVGQRAASLSGSQGMTAGANIGSLYQQQGEANANAQNTLAGIYTGLGNQLAGIAMDRGRTVASNYMNQGALAGQNFMNQGSIAAQSSIGQANAWTGAINTGLQSYGLWQGMQQPQKPTYGAQQWGPGPYSSTPSWGTSPLSAFAF